MINNVVLMGRICNDIELKQTNSGVSVTSFRIAVERNFVRQGEERQADFIDIVVWRQAAEFVSRYFHKGSLIAVQGSLQTRTFDDRNGNKKTVYEVVADQVSFCGREEKKEKETQPENELSADGVSADDDGELPF